MTGKKVMTLLPAQSVAGNKLQFEVNIAALPSGTYMYRYTLDQKTQTGKLVISH